ncbi:hypothetical protein CAPTEDRAFT_177468 [Capitella teleta]|uniref:Transporter n=1 Tax=Capitella teleta TaxID=283909 RepID=R7TQZ8_CAPTE|nr:hypothetical protein CAPTEDRAFT_177468 [Capitella teleta]|eukprot:ELT93916.1 hypothetical protein CAPTEDRAFT_177468 [Capitella teleta]
MPPAEPVVEGGRENWSGKLDFVMSALSFAVGMGNLWRFPYLCYKNGGGAFLIPYVISMILCGYPLMFIEMALGQYAGRSVVEVWKCCPLFEGIGWGMVSVSVFTGLYYNMIIAWCFFYVFSSFRSDVPWKDCGHWWNSEVWSTLVNTSLSIQRSSPSDDFFNNYMLDVSDGFHQMGGVKWELALCFLLCWVLVFLCLAKGITVSGKVTYITALFPYVVLTILLIRGLTLDGSLDGIIYYVKPDFQKLLSPMVWGDAAIQAFFSLSLCWGGLITLSSYNKFNNNCLRDTIVVATGDMLTSIFGGFVIFAILGYMANELQLPMDEVVSKGPGLAFIVYPEAITKLPISPLWAILFMLMLINVGLGSQMGLVSCVHNTLVEMFHKQLSRGSRPIISLGIICAVFYILGLSMCTRGGIYMLLLIDSYAATYALLMLDFVVCIAIGWVYGWERFYKDIEQMIGYRISRWWMICWRFLDPALILVILFFTLLDFKRSSYRDYIFPVHWEVMGWCISLISVFMVPIVATWKVFRTHPEVSFRQRLTILCRPDPSWCPANELQDKNENELQKELRERLNSHNSAV